MRPGKCHVFHISGPAQCGKTTIGLAMLDLGIARGWNVLLLVGSGKEAKIWKRAYGGKLPVGSIKSPRRPVLSGYQVVVVDSDKVTPFDVERMREEMAGGSLVSTLLWVTTINETEQPEKWP